MGIPTKAELVALTDRVRDVVSQRTRKTPLIRSDWLSEVSGRDVWLKLENLQRTGSFKVRGGVAAIATLPERGDSVVASSAGNHGQGLAFAAREDGVQCTIVVPRTVPAIKERAMRALGANVIKAPFDGYDATQAWTLEHLDRLGDRFISPFEHPAVMAGNGGTLLHEILDELDDVDTVFVPCGGGGCCVGMAVVGRDRAPSVRVVGVNSKASPGMWRSLNDDHCYLEIESEPTIGEGIEGGIGEVTFALGRDHLADVLVIEETTLRRAVVEIARHEHQIVEGAAAAGVGALLEGQGEGDRVVVVLTGSNIDWSRFLGLLGGEGS